MERTAPYARAARSIASVALVVVGVSCSAGESPGSNGRDPFFATYPQGPAVMAALYQGPLVVRDGCVLIGSRGEYSVPVWPDGFTAEPDQSGRLIVLDEGGAVIAIEGEVFEMSGGYRAEFRPEDKVEPRQDQLRRLAEFLGYEIPSRCLGVEVYGVWLVGDTHPITA